MRALLLPLLALPLFCQYGEFNVHGGASRFSSNKIGSTAGETSGNNFDTLLDNGWLFGFRVTLNQGSYYGHEFGYNYNRTKLTFRPEDPGLGGSTTSTGMGVHRSFYNFLLYAVPEGKKVRPFVAGGGHFSNFVQPGASVQNGQGENKFGFNYGAGVKVRVTDRWMLRFDLREYRQGKPFKQFLTTVTGGLLRQQEYSIGVSYTL